MTTEQPASFDEALEQQYERVASAFRDGWQPKGEAPTGRRQLVIVSPPGHAAIAVGTPSGGAALGPELQQVLRRMHDVNPRSFIQGVQRAEVAMTGAGGGRVVVCFTHEDFPGLRFGHRFWPTWGDDDETAVDDLEDIRLMQAVQSGALRQMMHSSPVADADGVVWTPFGAEG